MNITLHIERLILDGVPVPAHQLDAVRAGVEMELARLLAVQGLPPEVAAESARPALSGGALRLQPAINPHQLGMHIGEAIHDGFGDASAKRERTGHAQGAPTGLGPRADTAARILGGHP